MDFSQLQKGFETLIETISDTVVMTDLSGIVVYWNKGAEEVFGYSKAEIVGQPVGKLYPPDELKKIGAIREQVLQGQKVASVEILEHSKGGGTPKVILLSLVPVPDSGGTIRWLAGIGKDITRLRELEKEVVLAKERETVHDMMVGLNHEMNQPLTVLSMRLQLVGSAMNKGQPVPLEHIETAKDQVKRMAELLKKIREMRRVVKTEYLDGEAMVDFDKSVEG